MINHFPYINRNGVRIGLPNNSLISYTPYPKNDLAINFSDFDYTAVIAPDNTIYDNDAILYTGRGTSFDGINDFAIDETVTTYVPVTDVKVLARSETDTEVYTSLGTGTIKANNLWQEVEFETPAKNYGSKLWFDGSDDYIDTGTQLLSETADFTLTIEFIPVANGEGLFDQGTGAQAGRLYSSIASNKFRVFCSNFGAILDSSTTVNYGEVNTAVFSVTSGTASISLNGDTPVTTSAGAIDQVSNFEIGRAYPIGDTFNGLYKSLTIGATTWDGTESQAISNGWTVNGSPVSTGSFFTSPYVKVGMAGSGRYFSGDLADLRMYSSTGSILEEFYLNTHQDTAADSLNGKICVGRNGTLGTHNGCAAIVNEGMDIQFAKLGAYEDKLWFNGVDTSIDYGSALLPATADFDITYYWYIGETSAPAAYLYSLAQAATVGTTTGITLGSDGNIHLYTNSAFRITTSATPYYNTLVKVQFTRTSGVFELFLNDVSVGTYNGTGHSIDQVNTIWGNNSSLGSRYITGLIYGDDVSGTQSGAFNTVGEFRKQPPQVTGMNLSNYIPFDGTVGEYIGNKAGVAPIIPQTGDFTFTLKFVPTTNVDRTKDVLYSQAAGNSSGDPNRLLIYINTGTANVRAYHTGLTLTSSSEIVIGEENTFVYSRSGTTVSISLNGDTPTTGTDAGDFTNSTLQNTTIIGRGYIWDHARDVLFTAIELDGELVWDGSNKGVWENDWYNHGATSGGKGVAGEVLIPESFSSGIGAFGDDIKSLREPNTFNADFVGNVIIPSSDSTNPTTEASWVVKGNFYGSQHYNDNDFNVFGKVDAGAYSYLLYRRRGEPKDRMEWRHGYDFGLNSLRIDVDGFTNEENYFVVTFKSGILKFYWKGNLIKTHDMTPYTGGTSLVTSDVDIKLFGNTPSCPYNLTDFKMYNRELTSQEISEFFVSQPTPSLGFFPITLS